MLRKLILGFAASLTALFVLPAAAAAQGYYRDGYHHARHYDGYRGDRVRRGDIRRYERRAHRRALRRAYRRGYAAPVYYGRPYYGRAYYAPVPYARAYYGRPYRGRHYRCGNGTTGAIVGGAAGALIGRDIARDGYRRRGDGTVGAILGGAVGALVGREIDRGC